MKHTLIRPHYILCATLALACVSHTASASRAFTFSYEATTADKGEREYAQWVTWNTDKDVDAKFDRYDLRHELEFGITERWQLAYYFDWRVENGAATENSSDFRDLAVETIYQLRDPHTDPFGMALYGEVRAGDELIELEPKFILQKNLAELILVWNATLEIEWEGDDYNEEKAVLVNTLGASHPVAPGLQLGVEFVHEKAYTEWSDWQDDIVYIGPKASYKGDDWWLALTPAFQITGLEEESNVQSRLIFGFEF